MGRQKDGERRIIRSCKGSAEYLVEVSRASATTPLAEAAWWVVGIGETAGGLSDAADSRLREEQKSWSYTAGFWSCCETEAGLCAGCQVNIWPGFSPADGVLLILPQLPPGFLRALVGVSRSFRSTSEAALRPIVFYSPSSHRLLFKQIESCLMPIGPSFPVSLPAASRALADR